MSPISARDVSPGHFLRSGLKMKVAELQQFSRILAEIGPGFSAIQTGWRRGRHSNPRYNSRRLATTELHREVKSDSQSLRFVIAKNSPN